MSINTFTGIDCIISLRWVKKATSVIYRWQS